jgi:pimeloyl-ACP methyl ester carboxylesterase
MKRSARALAAIGVVLAVLVGAFTLLNWAPDRPARELADRWAGPPSTFLKLSGLRVHLRDEGRRDDPMPVVLLHGTSASLHTWDGWVDVLAPARRVVRVDLPGFGLTGPAPDGDYRIERYVEFVIALLDTLGIERCVVAGNSFGGWIAWETALAQPGRVGVLILVDSAGYPLESQSVPIGFRIARIPLLNRLMEVTLPRGVIESSLRNTYGDPSRVTPELVDRYYELTLREGNRAALAKRFADGRHSGNSARLAELQVPTLILWGGRDRLIPPAYGEQFRSDIAGSRLVVFPALGHVPHEEDAAATVAVVRTFLDELGRSEALAASTE